jgi:hypothetical protein
MKRLAALLAVTVVAVSVAAGIAYSAKPNPGFPNKDMVFGGGHFVFAGNSHTFSVSDVAGPGTLVYSAGSMVARLTCLTVTGNVAVVAGSVTSSTLPANVGLPVEMYFVDNGQPRGSTLGGDEVSPILIGGNLTGTCPAVADASQAPELDSLDAGDVTVHAAGP